MGEEQNAGVSPKDARWRVAFVHISGLCWSFFGYHLLIRAKQAGVALIDRPVATVCEQIAQIERLLREGIDVLIFRPMVTDHAGLLAVLQRAQAQGVHLVSIDGLPGGAIDLCSVSADNFGGQAALAEYVFEKMQGRGKIAYLQGDLRTEAGLLRDRGMRSVLRRYPQVELVYAGAFDWSEATFNFLQGRAMAREALTAHPDLDAIISATDEGALGVNAVLDEIGRRGKVMVAGFDGMPEGISAIHSGELEVTARQPLDTMAQLAFDLALGMVQGRVGGVVHHVQEVDLVTRANVGAAAMRALRVFPEITADLNQRVTAQKDSASFMETLLDVMPTMICVKQAGDLRTVHTNRARETWFDSPRGSQLGKTDHDLYPAEIAARYEAEDREVLASGVAMDFAEEDAIPGNVGKRYTRTRKVPIFDAGGRPDYLMVIAEDVTEQRLDDQALAEHSAELEKTRQALKKSHERLVQSEKMAALGTLVAGVSHELNTPIGNALMAVSTYADHTRSIREALVSGLTRSMLERYLNDAEQGVDLLERNLRRSAELIQSFKQIAVDQSNSRPRNFILAKVVAETLLALSPVLRKAPVVVVQNIPDDLVLDSFPGPLEQVLMALINNALIHGFEGRASGSIEISARAVPPERVAMEVRDDGVGIAAESIKRIYDPFFSTKFGQGRSGLGLGVARSIVTDLLGGQIEVDSRPGEGTRFTLTLPLRAGRSDD